MKSTLLLGIGRHMAPLPRSVWQGEVARGAAGTKAKLDFMSKDHHRVREFAVLEIPRLGGPLSPQYIANQLDLPLQHVDAIIDQLERNMTFLYRSRGDEVTWAYPVTIDPTPHRVTFSTGERTNAAWAIDAIAVPFVQGQLGAEALSFHIASECAHCGQPLHLQIDSDLNYSVGEEGADPLVFVPMVNFDKLEDPSIIDAF